MMNFTREVRRVVMLPLLKQKSNLDWKIPMTGFTTDIVIGVSERLCEMAQICKKLHHCKFKVFLLVAIPL